MVKRTHTIKKKGDKRDQIWEWEETPELLAAIEQLEKSSQRLKEIKVPTLHSSHNIAPFKRKNGKSV
tara:strand:- start:149 stop:349 length:201 start_codon:yes stop_codon:yes gene_type:complete